ncbi:hypothetical protein D3C83_227430 [compost metagenome]
MREIQLVRADRERPQPGIGIEAMTRNTNRYRRPAGIEVVVGNRHAIGMQNLFGKPEIARYAIFRVPAID